MPTVDLFPIEFRKNLPPLNAQQGDPDPIVYIKFLTRNSSWAWYVTEGCSEDDDFIFFGFVVGDQMEWGQFALSELNGPCGPLDHLVQRDPDFKPARLSEVLKRDYR
jgi:hypothetical protein